MIKGKTIYCTQKKQFYFVSEETTEFIKLLSVRKTAIFGQLQFSRHYFFKLIKDGELILS